MRAVRSLVYKVIFGNTDGPEIIVNHQNQSFAITGAHFWLTKILFARLTWIDADGEVMIDEGKIVLKDPLTPPHDVV
jgi:hypothetical protein